MFQVIGSPLQLEIDGQVSKIPHRIAAVAVFEVDCEQTLGVNKHYLVAVEVIMAGYPGMVLHLLFSDAYDGFKYARLGGHVLLLRPGRLLGNTRNYKCPRDDFTIRLIASILELGVAPIFDDIGGKNWQIDLTPVDYCARMVHRFSLQGETGIRHIINQDTISFEAIVDTLGKQIQRKSYWEWLQLVTQSVHLAPLSSLFYEPVSDRDTRCVFEVLLQMDVFRDSSYEATVLEDDTYEPPSTMQLLNEYLKANGDIFSNTR